MGLKEDLTQEVKSVFKSAWSEEVTKTVPLAEALRLNSNHAKKLENAVVLYADLDGSTNLVDRYQWEFAAEVYKSYLRCAATIARSEGAAITAYDGDRVMAIFMGESAPATAVRAAMKINYAVIKIINPELKAFYTTTDFTVKHVIGLDISDLRAARIGVKGDNDIVWVGSAANHAAKLCELSDPPLWITEDVYSKLSNLEKYASGNSMWSARLWTAMNNKLVYCSTYMWEL